MECEASRDVTCPGTISTACHWDKSEYDARAYAWEGRCEIKKDDSQQENGTWTWILLAVGVAGAVAFYVFSKKRNNHMMSHTHAPFQHHLLHTTDGLHHSYRH